MAWEGSSRKNFEMDRISNLPDEILAHILSFLQTKEAVQTCVLSKRWRKTWTTVPVLDFKLLSSSIHNSYGKRDESARKSVARFEQFVNGVLDNREQINLDIVRYARYVDDGEPPSTEWLDRVVLSMPRLIHIYINIDHLIDVPDLVFSCMSLQHLTMVLYTCAKKTIIAPASINLPSLKFLDLRGVELHDDFAQKLFEGCPSLESLVLVYCNLYISDISSDVLKELTITMCRQYKHMQVSCPAVVSLSIDIFDQIAGIQLKNMPSLVNANFQLWKRGQYSDGSMPVLNLFGGLSNTTSLKIYLGYPESKVLKKQLENNVPIYRDFINLKQLSIGNWNMSCDFYLIACLLKHSPNLIELTLYPEDFSWKRGYTQESSGVLTGSISYQHEYLETVKIYDGGARKLSQRLMKTLMKTLHKHVKKIGNIVIFSY